MKAVEQQKAAKQFAKDWMGRGDEKQETQAFWLALLQKVYGVEEPEKYIAFELPVKLDHTSFIDGYIDETRVLIEQKGQDISLTKGAKQSDGSVLTPFQQARRYAGFLPHSKNPRWIIVCNFQEFNIHDMERPNDPPEVVKLAELETEYYRLSFLTDTGSEHLKQEMRVSIEAGEIVGKLYDALLKQYKNPESAEAQKSLNKLCVRIVFCLYGEDAGLFEKKSLFHDYLAQYDAKNARQALRRLFRVLNQKSEERDPYLPDDDPLLAAFPYVNGGLFADEEIEIPPFNDEIMGLLLQKASDDFDWSKISPTIFGAVFESTLNPETRRSGGMHYTSIENIHKVIDPLFLDDLKAEFQEIVADPVLKTRNAKLQAYQDKLASLEFLDPAAGSGNFLTETYLSLRHIENEVIALLQQDQVVLGEDYNPIKVSISQFHGIEINDFAVTVAKTALWIAESQMMKETKDIVYTDVDFLPLKTAANIVEANALRIDWEDIVNKKTLFRIMGNPPFVGYAFQSKEQKDDLQYLGIEAKNIDYVAGWYFQAAKYMEGKATKTAFVSTNSICQGEQVISVWKPLIEAHDVQIDFAHQSFIWDSEASTKAHVHCVIVGFSINNKETKKKLFKSTGNVDLVDNINAYLVPGPDVFIEKRTSPVCNVPKMHRGSQPTDDGNFIFTAEEYQVSIKEEPHTAAFFRMYMGGKDFIDRKPRYCLWLKGISPSELRKSKIIQERIENVRSFRMKSSKKATQAKANTPTLFDEIQQPETNFVAIPKVSSSRRKYVPIEFLTPETVVADLIYIVEDASLYELGILTSNVHMAWMRTVCGRLKSDYRYSNTIVYNNFPWPEPTGEQKAKIEQTAQAILDARALYPDASLADLYDEVTMPPELRKAHQQNDKAVMQAYGFWGRINTEPEVVAELMKMYQELTK